MNVATAIALFFMIDSMGKEAIEGHTWSYERLQDSAMICVNSSCIVVPDEINAIPSTKKEKETEA